MRGEIWREIQQQQPWERWSVDRETQGDGEGRVLQSNGWLGGAEKGVITLHFIWEYFVCLFITFLFLLPTVLKPGDKRICYSQTAKGNKESTSQNPSGNLCDCAETSVCSTGTLVVPLLSSCQCDQYGVALLLSISSSHAPSLLIPSVSKLNT